MHSYTIHSYTHTPCTRYVLVAAAVERPELPHRQERLLHEAARQKRQLVCAYAPQGTSLILPPSLLLPPSSSLTPPSHLPPPSLLPHSSSLTPPPSLLLPHSSSLTPPPSLLLLLPTLRKLCAADSPAQTRVLNYAFSPGSCTGGTGKVPLTAPVQDIASE
jgi:hypothetical protein